MGAALSCMQHITKFVPREGVDGQDQKCQEIIRKMLFTDGEIDKLFTSFCDIDADNSGLVSNDEFLMYFSMEKTSINTKIFGVFDRDGSGCISFFEFICSIWNFLTLRQVDLALFVFDLFDEDKGGTMDFQELNEMLKTIHGTGYANNKGLMDVIEEMKMAVMSLTAVEFTQWNQNHPVLTGPILILQLKFQTDLYGKGFWKGLHERRYNHPEMIPMSFVSDLGEELESFYKAEEKRTRSSRRIDKMKASVGGRVAAYSKKDEKSKRRNSMILGKMNLKQDHTQNRRDDGEVKMNMGKLKKELNADIDMIMQPKSSLAASTGGSGSPKKGSTSKIAVSGKSSAKK